MPTSAAMKSFIPFLNVLCYATLAFDRALGFSVGFLVSLLGILRLFRIVFFEFPSGFLSVFQWVYRDIFLGFWIVLVFWWDLTSFWRLFSRFLTNFLVRDNMDQHYKKKPNYVGCFPIGV